MVGPPLVELAPLLALPPELFGVPELEVVLHATAMDSDAPTIATTAD
jgi:hypothetical protein